MSAFHQVGKEGSERKETENKDYGTQKGGEFLRGHSTTHLIRERRSRTWGSVRELQPQRKLIKGREVAGLIRKGNPEGGGRFQRGGREFQGGSEKLVRKGELVGEMEGGEGARGIAYGGGSKKE